MFHRGEFFFHGFDGSCGALRRCVTPVEEGVHEEPGRAAFGREFDDGVNMFLVAVDSAGRKQAHDVHGLAGLERQVDGVGERFVGEEGAGADRAVDARVFLVHHAAGAEVEVADFRVTHLAGRQADSRLRGMNQGVRMLLPERVPRGLAGRGDGVVLGVFTVAPSVQNDQNQWFRGK